MDGPALIGLGRSWALRTASASDAPCAPDGSRDVHESTCVTVRRRDTESARARDPRGAGHNRYTTPTTFSHKTPRPKSRARSAGLRTLKRGHRASQAPGLEQLILSSGRRKRRFQGHASAPFDVEADASSREGRVFTADEVQSAVRESVTCPLPAEMKAQPPSTG